MKKILIFLFFLPFAFALIFPAASYAKSGNTKGTISDSIDVINYSIHLNVVHLSNKTIAGYADLIITPKVSSVGSFHLWLLALNVDSVLINSVPVSNINYNDTLLRINLPAPVNPGDTFTLRVCYHGMPVEDPSTWGGFYFTTDSAFAFNIGVGFASVPHNFGRVWFPCIDDFVARATYDYYITTKTSKMAVCGGTLEDTINHGDGTKTWHWRMHNTIPSYLASMAVGSYVPVKGVYNGISGPVPTYIYVRAGDTNNVHNDFVNLNNVLAIYESRFGPYRFERVGYVGVTFSAGAMEHATNIAYPLAVLPYGLTYENLYAHELSHMWFGDLVTCATAEEMWLNEGWARYCEAVYTEGLYGEAKYYSNIHSMHQHVVQFAHVDDHGYWALNAVPLSCTYGTTSYEKGADVLHTLRNYLGDSLFFHTTKQYLTDHAFSDISTTGFRDYYSAKTGINLTPFFDAWFMNPGFPHFSIDSFHVNGTGPASVTVYVRQRLDHAPAYANNNILEVTFMNNSWQQYTDTISFSGASGSKTFQVPFVPTTAMLDLNEKVSDAITSYHKVIKSVANIDFLTTYCYLNVTSVTDSALVLVEHNYVPPDPLKTPNPGIKRLSDYRYWKVDGIFPNGFVTQAKFKYNSSTSTTSGYLDNHFMTTTASKDSLLLLYRRNTADDWKIIPFVLSGGSITGNLIIDTLRPGEYTLAIGTPVHFGIEKYKDSGTHGLKVYPNPSGSKFTIEWSGQNGSVLKVYNDRGIEVDSVPVKSGQNQIIWKPAKLESGTYVLKLFDTRNIILGNEKIIYLP